LHPVVESKRSSTVVEDIYRVVKEGYEVTQEQADEFGKHLGNLIAQRLRETKKGKRKFTLRMSNIGKGARQLWYEKRYGTEEELPPSTLIKFMFGDIIESLVLFLAELGGQVVTERQAEVHVDGVKGHIDADIGGVTIDVKSASTHAFRKFVDGTLAENDPFGYVEQMAGYCKARDTDGAFLAVDKQNGTVAYLPFSKDELKVFDVESRIKYIKDVIESDVEPERCYPDEEDGASGNRKLGVNCSYCSHKTRCWADANGGLGLRTFLYASGPKFLTHVAREPNVKEITF
jgi:hypothetical protein